MKIETAMECNKPGARSLKSILYWRDYGDVRYLEIELRLWWASVYVSIRTKFQRGSDEHCNEGWKPLPTAANDDDRDRQGHAHNDSPSVRPRSDGRHTRG